MLTVRSHSNRGISRSNRIVSVKLSLFKCLKQRRLHLYFFLRPENTTESLDGESLRELERESKGRERKA